MAGRKDEQVDRRVEDLERKIAQLEEEKEQMARDHEAKLESREQHMMGRAALALELETNRVPALERALAESRTWGKHGEVVELKVRFRDGYELVAQMADPRPPDLDEGQEPVVAKSAGEAAPVGVAAPELMGPYAEPAPAPEPPVEEPVDENAPAPAPAPVVEE